MDNSKYNDHTVSVVVPVCNNEKGIDSFLKALLSQNYNKDLYDIIVIDNGSTDKTREKVKKFNVKLLLEHEHLGSPYSARNRGIESSKGEIIALIDSNKIPKKDWLSEGINCLERSNADIVGGNVIFRFNGKITAGKVFDANTNIRMRESIEKRNVVKTANLFVRRVVFNSVGLFPEGVRSGGDIRWSRRASKAGFELSYCKHSSVYYSAKPLGKLIKKHWRVQLAKPTIWFEDFRSYIMVIKKFLKIDSLLSLKDQKQELKPLKKRNDTGHIKEYRLSLLMITFLFRVIKIIANYIGIFKIKREMGN